EGLLAHPAPAARHRLGDVGPGPPLRGAVADYRRSAVPPPLCRLACVTLKPTETAVRRFPAMVKRSTLTIRTGLVAALLLVAAALVVLSFRSPCPCCGY